MGTKIAELMTERPRAVTPQTSVREAARVMEEEDVGALPVVEEGARLVGMLTDRDVAIRVVGRGLDPEETRVAEVASADVVSLTPDHELDEALRLMARAQVRRLPIVVRENELVGMLAQADVARASKEKVAGEVVEAISRAPSGPRVAGADAGGEEFGLGERGGKQVQGPVTSELWTYQGSYGDDALTGFSVHAIDGEIGKIDEASHEVGGSYLVVDTGPWIFGKKVLLPAGLVRDVDRNAQNVFVSRTKDEIKNAPEFDQRRYRDPDYRDELDRYYSHGGGAAYRGDTY
jgi:CBS domain-containing protein